MSVHRNRRSHRRSNRRSVLSWAAAGFAMPAIANEPAGSAAPPTTALTFTPSADRLVAGSQSGLSILDLAGNQTGSISVEMGNVHCLQFSPDGHTLVVAGGNPAETGVIEFIEWPSTKRRKRWARHDDVFYEVQLSGDGARCLATSGDGVCSVITMPSGENESRFIQHSKGVTSAVFLPGGRTVVSGSRDQTLRVWESKTAANIRTLHNHSGDVLALAKKPSVDGLPMIASASADKTVRLWQPTIGRMVRFARLPSEPLCIAWCGDDQLIVGCRDGTARVIDSNTVKIIQDVNVSGGWLYCVAVSPVDQRLVAFGSDNGEVHRVNLS